MDDNYEQKKIDIAAKFKECFFGHGMVDTIVTQVTQDMHISKKTFYKYFKGGKQECLYYIFTNIAEESLNELTSQIQGKMTIKSQLRSVLERMFTIVIPFIEGNKAQTEADYILENQIVGEAFSKIYEPVIKNLLMEGKLAGEFEFKDVALIYDAITAIIKRSTILIHQDLSLPERQLEIQEETIRLILKIVG